MSIMKRVYLFLTLALITLFMSACRSGSEQASSTQETVRRSTDPVSISFWHTFNDDETKTLQALLQDFKSEYPHISVQLQQVPFSDALNKYKTVAQANNAPDLFRAEIAWTTELASLGYLMSLDAFLPTEKTADFCLLPWPTPVIRIISGVCPR